MQVQFCIFLSAQAKGTGMVPVGYVSREFELPVQPTIGMSFITPFWDEPRKVVDVQYHLGLDRFQAILPFETAKGPDHLRALTELYRKHGWRVINGLEEMKKESLKPPKTIRRKVRAPRRRA